MIIDNLDIELVALRISSGLARAQTRILCSYFVLDKSIIMGYMDVWTEAAEDKAVMLGQRSACKSPVKQAYQVPVLRVILAVGASVPRTEVLPNRMMIIASPPIRNASPLFVRCSAAVIPLLSAGVFGRKAMYIIGLDKTASENTRYQRRVCCSGPRRLGQKPWIFAGSPPRFAADSLRKQQKARRPGRRAIGIGARGSLAANPLQMQPENSNGVCAGVPANSLQMQAGAASENRVGVRVAVCGAARMRRRPEVRLLGFGCGGGPRPAALGLGGGDSGLARRGFLVFRFLGEAKGAQPAGLGRLGLTRAVGWRGEFRFAVHRCIRSAKFGFARLTRNCHQSKE